MPITSKTDRPNSLTTFIVIDSVLSRKGRFPDDGSFLLQYGNGCHITGITDDGGMNGFRLAFPVITGTLKPCNFQV